MHQSDSVRTLHFDCGTTIFDVTKPAAQISVIEHSLDMIGYSYPIFRVSEDTFKIVSNNDFSSEDLFHRIMLIVSLSE